MTHPRKAISGILSQEDTDDPNILHPIYYGSRTLVGSEKNYAVYELEMLAIVYFLKYFRYYLLGKHCKVITDHQSLRYMMKIKEDSPTRVVKWLLSIMEYDIEVYYRPGTMNGNADMLSRMPFDGKEELQMPSSEELIYDYYLPVFNIDNERAKGDQEKYHRILPDRYHNLHKFLSTISFDNHVSEQERRVIRNLAKNYYVNSDDNRIYRRGDDNYGPRYLVQKGEVKPILEKYHDHWLAGHLGVTRTFMKVSKEYYWPNYYDDVKYHITTCIICQQHSKKKIPAVPLQPIPTPEYGPMTEIMMDFCTLPTVEINGSFSHVLVIIDMFTGWIECHPCTNEQADITVLGLYEWICRYGIPIKVYCDGGPHFVAKVVDTMVEQYGITLAVGPSHHSQRQAK